MRRLEAFFALIAFGAFLLAANAATVTASRGSSVERSGIDFRRQVEKETFFLVNNYRKSHGLPMLIWSDAITIEARAHSQDMATGEVDFGHGGFRDRIGRLKKSMTGFRGAGENVLMSSDLDGIAKNAVTLWLHSPHHLENIRGDFNYSGLGAWQNRDGEIYLTQIFMKFVPAQESVENKVPFLSSPFQYFGHTATSEQ